jgi:5-hydroxyisourate hydrolase
MTVSTHVLDSSLGRPGAGISVALARLSGPGEWLDVEAGLTDADGRHRFAAATPRGAYRLTFTTAPYFVARGVATFYPEVAVTFMVAGRDDEATHLHVPLLLSPFAYSTYRGS